MATLKASPSIEARRQRGDALIEALIGTVIASAVGLGLAFTASRMIVSQRFVATENAVLNQMTYALAGTGLSTLCAGTTTPTVTVGSESMTLGAPTCSTGAVTVASTTSSVQSVTLPAGGVVTALTFVTPSQNTTAQDLVGGSGVMTIQE